MKTIFAFFMLFSFIQIGSSQISAKWIGGHSGRPNDWNCSNNWSNNKVPNEFTDVVVSFVDFNDPTYPIIKSGLCKVHSLRIQYGTILKIDSKAKLTVLTESSTPLDLRTIKLKGSLVTPNGSMEIAYQGL
ncbi:MAG: hypothetical protein ABIO44_11200 [Saprospiraceae bacterium]